MTLEGSAAVRLDEGEGQSVIQGDVIVIQDDQPHEVQAEPEGWRFILRVRKQKLKDKAYYRLACFNSSDYYKESTMKRVKQVAAVVSLSFAWFLVLPFRFEAGWSFFGGYRLLKIYLPYSDAFQHEVDLNHAFYSSHLYLTIFALVALLLGFSAYEIVKKLRWRARCG